MHQLYYFVGRLSSATLPVTQGFPKVRCQALARLRRRSDRTNTPSWDAASPISKCLAPCKPRMGTPYSRRLSQLTEAQARTEERLNQLAEAQARTK
jgi:hypothetical protein